MGDLTARLKAKFLRRNSASLTVASSDVPRSRHDSRAGESRSSSRGPRSPWHSVFAHAASRGSDTAVDRKERPGGGKGGDDDDDDDGGDSDSKGGSEREGGRRDGARLAQGAAATTGAEEGERRSLRGDGAGADADASGASAADASGASAADSTHAAADVADEGSLFTSALDVPAKASDANGGVPVRGRLGSASATASAAASASSGVSEVPLMNVNQPNSVSSAHSGSDLHPKPVIPLPSINENPPTWAKALSLASPEAPSLTPPSPSSSPAPVPAPAPAAQVVSTPRALAPSIAFSPQPLQPPTRLSPFAQGALEPVNNDNSNADTDTTTAAIIFDRDLLTPATDAAPPATPRTSQSPPPPVPPSPIAARPGVPRRQSILPSRQTSLIRTLLGPSGPQPDAAAAAHDRSLPAGGNMVTRKIWVKRPSASATLVTINEDDLVDDVREMILRKYANSLGRQFDAPDLTLRICPRDQQQRQLQPDEPMTRTLDATYVGGQTVEDALIIDVPLRRTPKASPNPRYYGEDRPHESGTDYFPPYPPPVPQPHHAHMVPPPVLSNSSHAVPGSVSVASNGAMPPLPSPNSSGTGGGATRRPLGSRPKASRMHTASPVGSNPSAHPHAPVPGTTTADQTTHTSLAHQAPAAPTMPTPPIPEQTVATPPPARVSSPRASNRPKKVKKNAEHLTIPPGLLNGGVPPINVLIVEDNIINLKLLEAFVKRLKVRWQTAMNGRDAVNKWRAGGFHLVLMDIQLPIMNGLEATREIRRIEKVNSIGVFSSGAIAAPGDVRPEPEEGDKLSNTEMFKSPVIIVALTASSLQSDRHEALAAGCNDFLTKPVNFMWLERKVMEWGCMQALIDFDGWRKWKDFSQKTTEDEANKKTAAAKAKLNKKNRLSMPAATAA